MGLEVFLFVPGILIVGAVLGWVARGHVHDIVDKATSAVKDAADKAASV